MNILHCLIIYLPTLILAQSNEDILKQLADEVAESSSEEMVSDLADLMTDPEMQTDPKLLREKIVKAAALSSTKYYCVCSYTNTSYFCKKRPTFTNTYWCLLM